MDTQPNKKPGMGQMLKELARLTAQPTKTTQTSVEIDNGYIRVRICGQKTGEVLYHNKCKLAKKSVRKLLDDVKLTLFWLKTEEKIDFSQEA